MSLNCGRSSTRDVESEAKPRRLPHEDDNALSNNALCVERVHNVITEMVQKSGRLPDVEAADTCTHHAGNNALAWVLHCRARPQKHGARVIPLQLDSWLKVWTV